MHLMHLLFSDTEETLVTQVLWWWTWKLDKSGVWSCSRGMFFNNLTFKEPFNSLCSNYILFLSYSLNSDKSFVNSTVENRKQCSKPFKSFLHTWHFLKVRQEKTNIMHNLWISFVWKIPARITGLNDN